MTIVLVHGVPESAAIWDEMLTQMQRDDVVALSPPEFGAPVPDGFADPQHESGPKRGAALSRA
jgi:pimeloyl-ACP methyl ester carboxylesterase